MGRAEIRETVVGNERLGAALARGFPRDQRNGVAHGADVLGGGFHQRARVEDIHHVHEAEALLLQQLARADARRVRPADHGLRVLGQQHGINGVLGHEIEDELVVLHGRNPVGLDEAHLEEFASDGLPEGAVAVRLDMAAQLGDHGVGEARAVGGDEHVAGLADEPPRPGSAQLGRDKERADLAAPAALVDEVQHVHVVAAVDGDRLLADLEDAEVEVGVLDADLGLDGGHAQHLARVDVFQHQDVDAPRFGRCTAVERGNGLFEAPREVVARDLQAGEAGTCGLREFRESVEVVETGGARDQHATSFFRARAS